MVLTSMKEHAVQKSLFNVEILIFLLMVFQILIVFWFVVVIAGRQKYLRNKVKNHHERKNKIHIFEYISKCSNHVTHPIKYVKMCIEWRKLKSDDKRGKYIYKKGISIVWITNTKIYQKLLHSCNREISLPFGKYLYYRGNWFGATRKDEIKSRQLYRKFE